MVSELESVYYRKSWMRHSGKLFQREVLQDQACRSATKVEGGACRHLQGMFCARGMAEVPLR